MIPAEKFFDVVTQRLKAGASDLGDDIVSKIKSNLSVPVTYEIGPRGGKKAVRSKRGEYPRTESGKLLAAVDKKVTSTPNSVTVEVFDPVVYSAPLNDKLDRPITSGILEDFKEQITKTMVDALKG